MMKKIITIVVAILLMIIVLFVGFKLGIIEKYSYSDKKADLNEYFQIYGSDEVPIILQDQLVEEKAVFYEDMYYMSYESTLKYVNNRFYYDNVEQQVLYTTPTDIIKTAVGSKQYTVSESPVDESYTIAISKNDTVYIAIDFLKKFTNLSYETFETPKRMQLFTEWGTVQTAVIKKNTSVRYQGGVKSEVLTDIIKGTKVVVLEEMETWTKVKTEDGFIGYVENKRLTDFASETRVPVTEYVEPEYTSIKKDKKINLVWNMTTNAESNENAFKLLDSTKGVNVISPTWYSLSDNMGNITSIADLDYVNKMHERGVEVWALVDNFSQDVSTYDVLTPTSSRTNLISQLISNVLSYGIDGINVDFESVPAEAGYAYVEFIRELSVACRNNGIVLSIDNPTPYDFNAHYNLKEQGIVADYVIIMGYDEHVPASEEVGSSASIDFVEQGIVNTVAAVPQEKVINAIPFFALVWTNSEEVPTEKKTMKALQAFLTENAIETTWDEVTCQNYARTSVDDVLYEVWVEDQKSIETKLNIMSNYQLAGVASWRLGQETPDIWDVIEAYLNK